MQSITWSALCVAARQNFVRPVRNWRRSDLGDVVKDRINWIVAVWGLAIRWAETARGLLVV